MSYQVSLHEDASDQLMRLDYSIREKLVKRMARMREEPPGRHLKYGLPYHVIEVGQYRIAYKCHDDLKKIYFAGDHKEYERWYKKNPR